MNGRLIYFRFNLVPFPLGKLVHYDSCKKSISTNARSNYVAVVKLNSLSPPSPSEAIRLYRDYHYLFTTQLK